MTKPNLLFPTPVWTIQLNNYKNINEKMYSFIKQNQKKDEVGINKSNVKGWHSKDFSLNDEAPQKFIAFILPAIEQVMTDMNWEKNKQIAKINNMWAIINTQVNSISPKEGALVLFPSYLDHSVNENLSNDERIVISFNIRIQIK